MENDNIEKRLKKHPTSGRLETFKWKEIEKVPPSYDNSTSKVTDEDIRHMISSAYKVVVEPTLDRKIYDYESGELISEQRITGRGHGSGLTRKADEFWNITCSHVTETDFPDEEGYMPIDGTYRHVRVEYELVECNQFLDLGDGVGIAYEVEASDAERDISVLRLNVDVPIDYFSGEFANPKRVATGDVAGVVGYPLNLGKLYTTGVIANADGRDRLWGNEDSDFYLATAAINPGNCLVPETFVTTSSGPKMIKDVKEGDFVESLDMEQNKVKECKVVKVIHNEDKRKVFDLKTTTRNVKATSNHPFLKLVRKGLERDEKGRVTGMNYGLVWCNLEDLKTGDVIVVKKTGETYKIEEKNAKSKELMKFCGFYLGDGYSRYREKQGGELHLYVFDEEKEEEYKKIMEKVFDKEVKTKNGTLSIYSADVAKKVIELGITGNSHTKTVPEWVFSQGVEEIKEFIQGYCESDGHLHKRDGCWVLEATSEDLIRKIRELCIQVGYRVSKIRTRTRKDTNLNSKGAEIIPRSPTWSFSFYEETRKEFKSLLGWGKLPSDFLPEELAFDRVSSIEEIGESETFDLTIEGTHNFIAENVVVHNSGGPVFVFDDGKPCYVGMSQFKYGGVDGVFGFVRVDEINDFLEENDLTKLIK